MKFEELPYIGDRKVYREELFKHVSNDNLIAEFGVATGRSAIHWLQMMSADSTLYCFDSWEGLPEDWHINPGKTLAKGAFRGAVPAPLIDDERCTIVKGWFEDTLPYDFPAQLGLLHIDCDLYSACKTVLDHVDPYIGNGTVIVFDEIWDSGKYPFWEQHEYKAYCEWIELTGKSVDWLLATDGGAMGIVKA